MYNCLGIYARMYLPIHVHLLTYDNIIYVIMSIHMHIHANIHTLVLGDISIILKCRDINQHDNHIVKKMLLTIILSYQGWVI